MGDKRDANSWDESEFGLGEGAIDPIARTERTLPLHQELWEIYARPKTFDGSDPQRPETVETPVPRLLPGEEESDRP
jgi:hypothetical protein